MNGRSWGVKSYVSAHWGLDRRRTYSEQSHSPPVWPTTADLHLSWDVGYEPGTLRGIGRKDGEVVCVQEIVTAGEAAQVDVGADRETITLNHEPFQAHQHTAFNGLCLAIVQSPPTRGRSG